MDAPENRGFASDNNSGIHPLLLNAITDANVGHAIAYGDDIYTDRAKHAFQQHFGIKAEVYFVLTGTGANVLSIAALTRSFHAVVCAGTAHINVDECGAPEKFCNCKLINISTPDGKLSPDGIRSHLQGFGFEHHVQPKVISISQPTEMGTVYSVKEIKALSQLAAEYDMYLHMDGARLANAAVCLNLPFKSFTADAGVDVLSFGGTKNGMLFGESVVIFRPGLSDNFKFIRKQGMQLASKMRFISAQFEAYLSLDIWQKNASHANQMATYLESKIRNIPEITITQKVEANAVFAVIPRELIQPLMERFFFYVWDETRNEVRWMTSFDTSFDDVDYFTDAIRTLLK